jgi:regulator of nucleoside diphosphate kinase
VLTELDHVRIDKWLDAHDAPRYEALRQLLDNADLVDAAAVAPDVITMRSRVRVSGGKQDGKPDGEVRELTLVYPDESDASAGSVSVLSPVGTALLGLRVGETARWQTPAGDTVTLRVDALAYQPEASGDKLK